MMEDTLTSSFGSPVSPHLPAPSSGLSPDLTMDPDIPTFGFVAGGILISAITTIVFSRVSKYLETTRYTYPSSIGTDKYQCWRWRNFLLSFIHSTVSGLGTVYAVYHEPNLVTDMIGAKSGYAYAVASFSHGYFIYDIIEMLMYRYKGSAELVFHHFFVICCLSISVWHNVYLGYAMLALTVELSNIFLHFRQLLNLAHVPKESLIYDINRWINLGCFIVFRMMALVFITYSLIEHRYSVPFKTLCVASTCTGLVIMMTCVLLYRLVLSDFGPNRRRGRVNTPGKGHDESEDPFVFSSSSPSTTMSSTSEPSFSSDSLTVGSLVSSKVASQSPSISLSHPSVSLPHSKVANNDQTCLTNSSLLSSNAPASASSVPHANQLNNHEMNKKKHS